MGFAENVLNKVRGTPSFKPASVDSFGNWAIEAGDVITVENDGVAEHIPIFSSDMSWNGSAETTMSCTGNQKREIQDKQTRKDNAMSSILSSYADRKLDELADSFGVELWNVRAALDVYVKDTEEYKEANTTLVASIGENVSALNLRVTSVKEELDGKVSDIETAQNSLTARVDGAEASLKQKAETSTVTALDGRVTKTEKAITSLETRAGNAESALEQKADSKTVTDLSGKVSDIETAQNSLTARVDGAEASLKLKASQDEVTGISSSVATLQADVIKLKGDTEIVGNLSIEDGLLKVNKGIRTNQDVYANKFHSVSPSIFFGGDDSKSITLNTKCQINPDSVVIGSNAYQATQITSTTGAVLALGIA